MNSAVSCARDSLMSRRSLISDPAQFVRGGRAAARHELNRMENLKSWAMRIEQFKLRDPEKNRQTALIVVSRS